MDTILILEADSKVAGMLRAHLEKYDYEVVHCTHIQEAQASLATSIPDLFLIDLNVADDQFFSFYSRLQSQPQTRPIPRIFIEGSSRGDLAEQLRSQSSDIFLKKPLRLSELMTEINNVLGSTQEGYISHTGAPSVPASLYGSHVSSSPPSTSMPPAPPAPSLPPEPDPHANTSKRLNAFLGRSIGNVTLQREIGRGGMGAVFLGQQTTLERQVAVKVMLPDLVGETSALARFRREALAIARLKSPHIVQVFDAGETEDKVFYIVMEFLEGGTLDDFLQMAKRCTIDQTIDILKQVANGLEVAHKAGLIHRDLKPSNLMINKSGHVTITDFGLVREHGVDEQNKLTRQGSLLGTPYYLSPEQASGAQLDPRTDIYSLGIIGYELLTGKVPFNSHNLLDILVMHHNLPLPDPRQENPGVPEALVNILMRMAAKKPDQRYSHTNAILHDLQQLATHPVHYNTPTIDTAAHSNANSPAHARTFQLTTRTGDRLSAFSNQSEVSLQREDAEGKAMMRSSGEIFEHQGFFPESWQRALSVCIGAIQQIQTLAHLGPWKFAQVESPDRILHIHPHSQMYEAILLQPSAADSSMSLDGQAQAIAAANAHDPLDHICSIAGVQGVLMFDTSGQLVQKRFNGSHPSEEEAIRARLAPLPQLLQSMPISFVGLDISYQAGRVLIWDLEQELLFVLATPQINKILLTMALASQLGLLKTKRSPSPNSFSASIYPEIPMEHTAPTELMDQLKKEYARSIGPIAELTMKKEAKRMGFSRKSFPKHMLSEYVERLGAQLDGKKQSDFLKNANALLAKMGM